MRDVKGKRPGGIQYEQAIPANRSLSLKGRDWGEARCEAEKKEEDQK